MTTTATHSSGAAATSQRRDIALYGLWAVQAGLALIFLFAGGTKLILPVEEMTREIDLPGWFLRFIGGCEVLGAIGILFPGVLRTWRVLTPLAASGLVIIMVGATVLTVAVDGVLPAVFPFAVGVFVASVIYGRRSWIATSGIPRRRPSLWMHAPAAH